jgi:hypothetical protein
MNKMNAIFRKLQDKNDNIMVHPKPVLGTTNQ